MSDWRVSVLLGQDSSGKWDAIAMPDKSIDEQKKLFKAIVVQNGLVEIGKGGKAKTVQLQKILQLDRFRKRASFHPIVTPQPEIMA